MPTTEYKIESISSYEYQDYLKAREKALGQVSGDYEEMKCLVCCNEITTAGCFCNQNLSYKVSYGTNEPDWKSLAEELFQSSILFLASARECDFLNPNEFNENDLKWKRSMDLEKSLTRFREATK